MSTPALSFTHLFAACGQGHELLQMPTWYAYLPCSNGQPALTSITDVWLIVVAIIEILLRIAALAAVGYVIWGGALLITSQGEPDKAVKARGTVISALIGLVIAVLAAALVNFLAGTL